LLDEVQHRVPFYWAAFRVEPQRPIVRNPGLRPIDAESREPDLAVANQGGNSVSVLAGNGDGY
jgi:hypothetical protein